MGIATKICNKFVLIVLCHVIIVQLIDRGETRAVIGGGVNIHIFMFCPARRIFFLINLNDS